MEIEEFLKEVRQCRFCRTDPTNRTPFVYSSADPGILVVSEMPPLSAWKANIGRYWEERDLFARRTKGAPHKLCEWLEIERNKAKDMFFWIQRANCAVTIGKSFAFQHCSSKFLDRAIDLIKPKLILVLGRVAAEYFFQFTERVKSMMGQIISYRGYDCIVLYHPSPAAGKWQHKPEQEKSIKLARRKINEVWQNTYGTVTDIG